MDCRYSIEFFSDWHCGSGLAAGADIDLLVVKDKRGLPFVPGKTVKGLLREAVEVLCGFGECSREDVRRMLGEAGDKQDDVTRQGACVFSNATLRENAVQAIIAGDAVRFLYRNISSTAIGDDGTAKEHSLRSVETVVPCRLEGMIYNVPQDQIELLSHAAGMVKRMGQSRNRGFGRCDIKIEEGGKA